MDLYTAVCIGTMQSEEPNRNPGCCIMHTGAAINSFAVVSHNTVYFEATHTLFHTIHQLTVSTITPNIKRLNLTSNYKYVYATTPRPFPNLFSVITVKLLIMHGLILAVTIPPGNPHAT